MTRKRTLDFMGGTIFLSLAIYVSVTAHSYGLWTPHGPGPGLFPFLIAVFLGLLSGGQLLSAALQESAPGEGHEQIQWVKLSGYLLALIAYGIGMGFFGHILITASVFLFIMLALEHIKWKTSLIVTAAAVVGGYLLFERFLSVPLPRGTIW